MASLLLVQGAWGEGGLELTKAWTNMALGYVSYDVYMRKFTGKRHFARAATSTRPLPMSTPPQQNRPHKTSSYTYTQQKNTPPGSIGVAAVLVVVVGPDLRVRRQLDQHLRLGSSALEPRRVDDEAHRRHHY